MKKLHWKQARDLKVERFLKKYENTGLKKLYGEPRWIRIKVS